MFKRLWSLKENGSAKRNAYVGLIGVYMWGAVEAEKIYGSVCFSLHLVYMVLAVEQVNATKNYLLCAGLSSNGIYARKGL